MFRGCHTRAVRKRLLAVVLLAAIAEARMPLGIPRRQPIILELTGHFTADREAARRDGAAAISIEVEGRERWFAVATARNRAGDAPSSGPAVLAALAPTHPTLRAVGDPRLRRRLAEAAVGTALRIEGLVDGGSHAYLLRDVATAMSSEPRTP